MGDLLREYDELKQAYLELQGKGEFRALEDAWIVAETLCAKYKEVAHRNLVRKESLVTLSCLDFTPPSSPERRAHQEGKKPRYLYDTGVMEEMARRFAEQLLARLASIKRNILDENPKTILVVEEAILECEHQLDQLDVDSRLFDPFNIEEEEAGELDLDALGLLNSKNDHVMFYTS